MINRQNSILSHWIIYYLFSLLKLGERRGWLASHLTKLHYEIHYRSHWQGLTPLQNAKWIYYTCVAVWKEKQLFHWKECMCSTLRKSFSRRQWQLCSVRDHSMHMHVFFPCACSHTICNCERQMKGTHPMKGKSHTADYLGLMIGTMT